MKPRFRQFIGELQRDPELKRMFMQLVKAPYGTIGPPSPSAAGFPKEYSYAYSAPLAEHRAPTDDEHAEAVGAALGYESGKAVSIGTTEGKAVQTCAADHVADMHIKSKQKYSAQYSNVADVMRGG